MGVTIKSDNSTDEARVDPVSKAVHVTLYDTAGNPIGEAGSGFTVIQPQIVDAGNSAVRTSVEGATQFVGAWYETRVVGIVRQLTVIASTVSSGLGGTFVFQYSEDGATATISEPRTITDFSTVRDFDLLNAGAYYRVLFTPDRALVGGELIFINTTQRTQNDGQFVRLADQEMEEQNSALGSQFSYLKSFDPKTGKSRNIRSTRLGALRTSLDNVFATQSASIFTEGIIDQISLVFSRDSGVAAIASLVDNASVNGTVTHVAAQGQAEFAVPITAASTCYRESELSVEYTPGHMIRGGQTIEISAQPTGDGKIEWGFGEDDGAGDVLNGIGYGWDATGFYCFRKKTGAYASKVYQDDFNRDTVDGTNFSFYRVNDVPVPIDLTNNGIFEFAYEWYGIAPPTHFVTTPAGVPITTNLEETTGQQTGTTVPEPNLPMFIRVQNDTTVGQVLAVRTGSWRGGIFSNKALLVGKNEAGEFNDLAINEFDALKVDITSDIPTYSATALNLVAVATPTDVFTVTGSATKVVRISRILVSATRTVAGTIDLILLRRSTANTGGVATNPTIVPHDTNNDAATAVINAYSVNPTTGTLVGNISAQKVFVPTNTAIGDRLVYEWGIRPSQEIVLRGVNEIFAINLNAVSIVGNSFDISVEFKESEF